MFDAYLIEKDSLKNDIVDGKIVGFSFGVRISNYRGNFLSLINGFYVNVDGTEYPRELQTFEVNGKPPRTIDELETCCWEHWDLEDTAYLHIKKEGGLEPGMHKVKYLECILGNYGYSPTDEEFVKNPPQPGDIRGSAKTLHICKFELELQEDK